MVKYLQNFLLAINTFSNQLWLSVTKADFYYDVYKYYKGYGLKYLLTISFITSTFYSLLIYNYLYDFKNYFLSDKLNYKTSIIENILVQLPCIFYDGKNISIEEPTPYYLYDKDKNKLAVIDPNGEIPYQDKIKIPVNFSKDKINFSFTNNNNFGFEYYKLFGTSEKILTNELIKRTIGQLIDSFIAIFVVLGPLILLMIYFISNFLENIFLITIIYMFSKFYLVPMSLKTSIRLSFYANGACILLETILSIVAPQLSKFTSLLSLWPVSLLFIAIKNIKEEQKIR